MTEKSTAQPIAHTPVALALQIAMETLAMPNWDQDEMICALTNIARLLAAQNALDEVNPC
jgi:hypothetical protein